MKKKKKIEDPIIDETNWREQFIRVNADFQNYKRRMDTDKLRWVSMAQIKVIETFLPLLDELNLAIASSEQHKNASDFESWIDGFKMIRRNLQTKLDSLGVKEIDCSSKFDPNFHEALMQVDSEDHEEGAVVAVLSPGYTFNDEVIRHAKVSVSK